jgi:hypothetical protein
LNTIHLLTNSHLMVVRAHSLRGRFTMASRASIAVITLLTLDLPDFFSLRS